MGWAGAALGVANSLYGGNQARKAADANKKAAQASAAEFGRARDAAIGYQQPYLQYGQGAGGLGGLQALMSGDYSGFMNSPDYLASQKAGIYALDHSAAAKGRLNSGGFAADLQNAGQDHAAGYLGNYRNALFQGAGIGQQAANQSGAYQMNAAQGISNGLLGVGQAQAQRYGANAGQAAGLFGLAGQYGPSLFGGSSYGSTTPANNWVQQASIWGG